MKTFSFYIDAGATELLPEDQVILEDGKPAETAQAVVDFLKENYGTHEGSFFAFLDEWGFNLDWVVTVVETGIGRAATWKP